MLHTPETHDDLAEALSRAARHLRTICLQGNGSKSMMAGPVACADENITTTALRRVLEYEPRDLTISVEAGLPWHEFTALLRQNRQMVPLDPPFAGRATVGGVVASNSSGPRRRLYGTARDMVIGMRFVTLAGKLVQSGGMVVKNVAGLDMAKLLIGSFGTLAAIAVVNFKLQPMPEVERTVLVSFADSKTAFAARARLLASVLQPAAIDLFNPPAAVHGNAAWILAVRAAGNQTAVDRYQRELASFGDTVALDGAPHEEFWRFPGFPQTVISTACFDHRERSGGDLHRSLHPVLLELHRADVVQRRVHACSVIPKQPCDDFILGFADGGKTLAVQPFHLQRTKQRLRAGVIPAVALAAHRRRNAMLFEYLTEVVAGVLAATIAVKDQLCLLARIALEPGHLQRIDHQVALHIWPHRPAHHFTAEQVDHYPKKQPAFCGRDICHITNPRPVGRGHDELAIEHIRRDRQVVPAVGGSNAESALAASLNAVLLHQPLHPQLAHANALRPQLPPDARPSIRSAILRIDGADVNQQCFVAEVPALSNIHTPRQVFMIARDAHQQHPALHTDRPDQLVALNKGVLHFWHFASRVARRNFTSALSQNRT